MASKTFDNEFLKSLELLSKEQQLKVITYVKELLRRTRRSNKQPLLQFAGSLKASDLLEMSSAIKADCENIETNDGSERSPCNEGTSPARAHVCPRSK